MATAKSTPAPLTIDQAIALAVKSHKEGNSLGAAEVLLALVRQQPTYVPSLLALSSVLTDNGDHPGAAIALESACKAVPGDFNLKIMLGNALQAAGQPDTAAKVFEEALKLSPGHPLALNNLGSACQAIGQRDRAVECYRASISAQPAQDLATSNLGMVYLAEGNFADAAGCFRAAILANPRHVSALHHFGVALLFLHRPADAETAFRAALDINPQFAPTLSSFGMLLVETGRAPEGIKALRAAAQLTPNDTKVLTLLGSALLAVGEAQDGLMQLAAALDRDPTLIDVRILLINALIELERFPEAMKVGFSGLLINGENETLRQATISALRETRITSMTPPSRLLLMSFINNPTISTQSIATAITDLVRNAPYFGPLLAAARAGNDPITANPAAAHALMEDELLRAALPQILVTDSAVELVLTAIRRAFLFRAIAEDFPFSAPASAHGPFVAALARHCFTAEYVQFVQPYEQQKIDALKAQIEEALAQPSINPKKLEWPLAIYSLYAPLHSLAGSKKILNTPLIAWSSIFADVIREQVVDKAREATLAAAMPELTPINHAASGDFLALYEANPYPRWRSLDYPAPETLESLARRLRPQEPVPTFKNHAILVAGCGTGQHPLMTAIQFPQAQVTALDFSATALAYGQRMADREEIKSVLWRRGDLLELGNIHEKYALVDCAGVLHHVKDPAAALVILRDRLLPGGIMKVSVYSSAARQHLESARTFVKINGFADTADGIRAARHAILSLPELSPQRAAADSSDFYATSTCRFLVLPVEEHAFTLPQLAGLIDRAGLRFLGFDLSPGTLRRFRIENPAPGALVDLNAWAAFEENHPDTFAGMYQLWLDAGPGVG